MAKSETKAAEQAVETQSAVDAEPVETAKPKAPAKQEEPIYTVEELAAGAKEVFGTMPECVIAALKAEKINECSVSKAKEIVGAFIKKEVK